MSRLSELRGAARTCWRTQWRVECTGTAMGLTGHARRRQGPASMTSSAAEPRAAQRSTQCRRPTGRCAAGKRKSSGLPDVGCIGVLCILWLRSALAYLDAWKPGEKL